MIVCSHCQFENPQGNKFCQQCGTPLKVWRVILTETQAERLPLDLDSDSEVPSTPKMASRFSLSQGNFLDAQQRYLLLTDLTLGPLAVAEATVIDTQPEQPSPLLQRYNSEQLRQMALMSTENTAACLTSLPLPQAAYAYLALQENFFPSVPELQDAWIMENYSLILIEDRTDLPRLLDVWGQAILDPLQQIHGFYTMVELWDKLLPFNGQTSLLRLDNLCIDEDQIFCLRQIDSALTGTSHTLQDLGLLWQSLLHATGQPPLALLNLADGLIAGTWESVDELKQALIAIADQVQTDSIPATPVLDKPPILTEPAIDLNPSEPGGLTPADDLDPLVQFTLANDDLENDGDFEDDLDDEDESTDLATMVLPMKLIGLEEGGHTHVGQQRDHNEDAYFIQSALKKQDGIRGQKLEAQSLYILCDGMGGHAGGEVASRLAVETLQNYFDQQWQGNLPSEPQLREAIGQANQVIYERNLKEERSGNARMGTTLVLMLLNNTQAVVAHVGDSRLYRYTRRLGLQQITVDHEVGQREIQRGIEPAIAYARPDAYQLTQALGPRDQSELMPGVSYLNFTEDTLLLLCSDGLSDHDLLETHYRTHLEPILKGPKSVEEGIADLIDLANEVNGHDNITAVAVKLKVKPNLEKIQMG